MLERDIGSMTAPDTGSMGAPSWTARVPNLWTGEGARGGVSIGSVVGSVIFGDFAARRAVVVKRRLSARNRLPLRYREVRSGSTERGLEIVVIAMLSTPQSFN